jgi:hypothetical protein
MEDALRASKEEQDRALAAPMPDATDLQGFGGPRRKYRYRDSKPTGGER